MIITLAFKNLGQSDFLLSSYSKKNLSLIIFNNSIANPAYLKTLIFYISQKRKFLGKNKKYIRI